MPRWSAYQRASALGSRARKNRPPMPVTRSIAPPVWVAGHERGSAGDHSGSFRHAPLRRTGHYQADGAVDLSCEDYGSAYGYDVGFESLVAHHQPRPAALRPRTPRRSGPSAPASDRHRGSLASDGDGWSGHDERRRVSPVRKSVAEGGGALVADPLPHGNGATQFGALDELALVEPSGIEADRADQIAAFGLSVPVDQLGQRRAALARDRGGDALQRQPRRLLGQEHERRAALLGRADGDQEGHGDPLGVLEPGGQTDNGLSGHGCLPFALPAYQGSLWSATIESMRESTGFPSVTADHHPRIWRCGAQVSPPNEPGSRPRGPRRRSGEA